MTLSVVLHMCNRLCATGATRTRPNYPQNRNPSSDPFDVIAGAYMSVDLSVWIEPNATAATLNMKLRRFVSLLRQRQQCANWCERSNIAILSATDWVRYATQVVGAQALSACHSTKHLSQMSTTNHASTTENHSLGIFQLNFVSNGDDKMPHQNIKQSRNSLNAFLTLFFSVSPSYFVVNPIVEHYPAITNEFISSFFHISRSYSSKMQNNDWRVPDLINALPNPIEVEATFAQQNS